MIVNLVIIQEAGRHEKNRDFRESLNLHRSLSKIEGISSKVWGLNYENFNIPFNEIESWADVILILENYTPDWLPMDLLSKSNKLKIFWSIDSHCVLNQHLHTCKSLNIDIVLNSTEYFLPHFKGYCKKSIYFPNAYPSDLIYPMNIEKKTNIGFCGNVLNRGDLISHLSKFDIKKDIFVIGEEMVRIINSYKIHFNKNISIDINYRTFETCGCGTFLLTNYTPNLEKLFDIGNEIVVYNDLEDLDKKVTYYLENEEEREAIAKAGYQRAIKNHTYDVRALQLIDLIKSIK